MKWTVSVTDDFASWWRALPATDQDAIIAVVHRLERMGPTLGQTRGDSCSTSLPAQIRHILLVPMSNTRVIFGADGVRRHIALIGGDDGGGWEAWYDDMMPIADALYEQFLSASHAHAPHQSSAITGDQPFAHLAIEAETDPVRRRRIAVGNQTIDDALGLAVIRASRGKSPRELIRRLDATEHRIPADVAERDFYNRILRTYLITLGEQG